MDLCEISGNRLEGNKRILNIMEIEWTRLVINWMWVGWERRVSRMILKFFLISFYKREVGDRVVFATT